MNCGAHGRDTERVDRSEHFPELGKRHWIVWSPVRWQWPQSCPINTEVLLRAKIRGVAWAHIF